MLTLLNIGAAGYYLGTVAPAIILGSCVVVYFIIMAQMFYPMTLATYAWSTGTDPTFHTEPTLQYYSITHIAIGMFLFLTVVCLKTDMSFFMQVSSAGVIFLMVLILFIITKGIQAFGNTEFMIGSTEQANTTDWSSSLRTITVASANYAPVAGILCPGYFLHVVGVPILRNAKEPKNN